MSDTVSRRSSTTAHLRRLGATAAAITAALAAALLSPAPAQAAGSVQAAGAGQPALVRTDAGWVRGETTTEGRQFLGIPYAQPPVGDLRWTDPRPTRPWHGVREAREFGNRCAQPASWDPGYEQPSHTEDCLDLNVYVPEGRGGRGGRPVMVWLHGGGLTAGAGEDIVPDTFARRTGAVVVTVNYRLGAMGFLATADLDAESREGVSGNFGMLDQQAALRWVRANIGRFGGDPGRVTIAGESAGGRSVCNQMASPTSKGLFHAGIVQSGAYGDCAARTRETAVAQGRAFMAKLDCADTACLRAKPAAEILAAQAGLNWGPVIGGDFLPEQPAALYAKGAAARVPVLNGANQDEGRLFSFARFDAAGTPLTAEQYPGVMRTAFGDRALDRYPLSAYPSPTIAHGTAQGDQLFACPALRLTGLLADRGPVYAYEFADRTSPPFASLRNLGTDFDFGATHVNEVQYLFRHFGLETPLNAEQRALSRQMIDYWGSFIRDGVPRAAGQPAAPADGGKVLTLRAAAQGGNGLSATVHSEHRCDLWDNL